MSAKFYTLLTDIGAAKLASAAALGVPLKITHMAVGSGGGVLPTPNAQQTALVAEERRAALNMLYIDPQNSSQIIAEQVIPENEGGWWIREVGLFDETGALIAVGIGCHWADRRWCYLYLAELGHAWTKIQGNVGCRM